MPRPAAPALALGVSTLGAGGAVWLWWDDTASFGDSLGNELTNAGRLMGLLGGYLVAVLLVLMARVPLLDRTLGAPRLARWHSALGRYVVCALVAHAALITWGYAASAHRGIAAQVGRLWERYPDVLMATVALGLLIGVGVASARRVRRHLAYETWHLLHLYTYLAIALAFAHGLANGAELSRSERNRVLWSAVYVVAVGSVVVFRWLIPAVRALRVGMVVERVVPEAPGVVSVHLSARRPWRWEPGQFVRLRFLDRDGWWQVHPFSLSSSENLRVTVKAAGDHTGTLASLRPGTRVLPEGPYGAFTGDRRTQEKVLLVAGGVGITPLLPLLETLPGEVTLLWRASTAAELPLRDDVIQAARRTGARLFFLIGPRGDDPLSSARLRALVPGLVGHDVFVCGPSGLVTRATAALCEVGVQRHRIHVEQFSFQV